MIVKQVDDYGKYIGEVDLIHRVDEDSLPFDYVAEPIPEGMENPYWDFEKKEWYDKAALKNEDAEELKKQLEELQSKLNRLSTGN